MASRITKGWKELKNLEGWTLAHFTKHFIKHVFPFAMLSTWLYMGACGHVLFLTLIQRTGLKALYAECNAFDRISGLSLCRNLRSLFLQALRIAGALQLPRLPQWHCKKFDLTRLFGCRRRHLRQRLIDRVFIVHGTSAKNPHRVFKIWPVKRTLQASRKTA